MRATRGINKIELLVASSMLSALMLIAIPLIVRLHSVWKSTRMFQLATLELTNRMESLRDLDPSTIEMALKSLDISEGLKASLPNAELCGDIVRNGTETRLILRMTLDPTIRREPLVLVTWIPEMENSP